MRKSMHASFRLGTFTHARIHADVHVGVHTHVCTRTLLCMYGRVSAHMCAMYTRLALRCMVSCVHRSWSRLLRRCGARHLSLRKEVSSPGDAACWAVFALATSTVSTKLRLLGRLAGKLTRSMGKRRAIGQRAMRMSERSVGANELEDLLACMRMCTRRQRELVFALMTSLGPLYVDDTQWGCRYLLGRVMQASAQLGLPLGRRPAGQPRHGSHALARSSNGGALAKTCWVEVGGMRRAIGGMVQGM